MARYIFILVALMAEVTYKLGFLTLRKALKKGRLDDGKAALRASMRAAYYGLGLSQKLGWDETADWWAGQIAYLVAVTAHP